MKSDINRWSQLWKSIKESSPRIAHSIAVPSERWIECGDIADRFNPGDHYFAVFVNELFLANDRKWLEKYDPMAVVITEFEYDGQQIAVPFVVGPSLLSGKIQQVPQGMVFSDTLVAGPHPYRGGTFSITMILAKVRRESYPKKLLNVIEKIAGSFPTGAALDSYLKVAGVVFDGIEALFDLGDTTPLVGHRWDFNPGLTPWLKPGFITLINADHSAIDEQSLHVQRGRLRTGPSEDAGYIRNADYLLYSLRTVQERADVGSLPFAPLFQEARYLASSSDEGAWERAKATLVTLNQQLITSPDLTWGQAKKLANQYKAQLIEVHEMLESFGTMGSDKLENKYTRGRSLVDNYCDEREQKISEIHHLLDL